MTVGQKGTAMKRREFKVPGSPEPVSHYTDVVTYGGLAFVSGALAVDTEGNVVGRGDPAAQAECVLEHLGRALKTVGCSPADVLRVNVYITNIGDHTLIRAARERFFGDARPASTLVEVGALVVPDCCVEIDLVAAVPKSTSSSEGKGNA
ncbi:RidA family protein [Pseudonocardia kujensis]|uniref:RidA family protein n=1 Tax=Pseudonocardia kujensis TaxID=1128675 RepID=UPI001E329B01|nr:RidA family protein [Pseudonocardia kujensis]MCE0767383.1 RidA family protein [Pseudonocardia kujensis]